MPYPDEVSVNVPDPAMPGEFFLTRPEPDRHTVEGLPKKPWGGTPPPPRVSVPMLLGPEHNPVLILTQALDLAIAANTILVEEFDFHEIYRDLINIIRNDDDPKTRMAAMRQLHKFIKDSLTVSGKVSKVTLTEKIRSPDGTTAERSVITRSLSRSLEGMKRVEPEGVRAPVPIPLALPEGEVQDPPPSAGPPPGPSVDPPIC